ncbi:MAG: PstS family phosphate ABC transporter substrate-binding protein [Desulfomonile tiedjei]|uniref:PstS family phosphate ABC transporter substrate-binding protein n=1 Tax=Desulfomonile tiedjei TaxID=2358 RepID=A0A9D6V0B1_9BACT|nr:PstS family phosphate ABC transporter substrate-binding protein [Desulfomonile tiedjei]
MMRTSLRGLIAVCVLLIPFLSMTLVHGQASKLIRVKGSNVMAGMCDAWGTEFNNKNPGIRVHVTGGGTAAGIEAVFERTADLAMASRRLIEKELQLAAVSDAKPAEMAVAQTAVVIVTHPANPVKELTLAQLKGILTGEIASWNQVNGPRESIFLITSAPESGTSSFLRNTLFPEDYLSSDANVRNFFHDILKEISLKKPPALGYAGLYDAMKAVQAGRVKLLALKRDENSPAVLPTLETVKDRTYPLIMQLYFYWDKDRAPEHLKQFVDFCKTKGTSVP